MSTSELLSRLREAGVRLSVRDGQLNVSAPKGALNEELRRSLRDRKAELIELLADADSAQRPEDSSIPVADRSQPIPLSFAQQRIWFLEEFEGGSSVYNIPWAMRVRGKFDVVALQAALNDLARRHESLRTVFVKTDKEPVQEIRDDFELNIEIIKMHGADKATVRRQIESWARQTFELTTGPLFRVGVIETGSRKHVLVLVIHHIISDGWSLDVLQNELFSFYLGHVNGELPELEPLQLQLADYAAWQRNRVNGSEFERQLDYWKNQLRGAPALLELPTDRQRPSEQSYHGTHLRRLLPAKLSKALQAIAKEQNATLFMVLLTAFKIFLARYSGQDDIVVGTPIAGRQQTELEGLIGLFLNTLAMRTDVTGNPTFTELLKRVQATSLDAFAHQDIPFDRIVDALHPTRDMSHSPVYQVQFMLQNAPANGSPVEGLEFQHVEFDYGTSKFDLTLATAETEDGLAAEIEYCTDLFDEQSIERMLEHFEILLQGITANPEIGIRDLPLIDDRERTVLLVDWNATKVDYPAQATLQSLLEQQAESSPHAP
ncbi:MAG: condensation domain-containing protein, partial [Gammaproteobacteria bacterium]|nr:condensation domain-containing protein [Gammaproteobacteria bacterium]